MLWDELWRDRGSPWEYDPGPAPSSPWVALFADTPNYRQVSRSVLGRDIFRWHHGPMFYRGRLTAGGARVLVIGQEGAQDEALAHRSFTGGSGARLQHLLRFVGIDRSYLFLNTFVYSIVGEYHPALRPLAQHASSAVVQHRQRLLEHAAQSNDLALVISVGNAAKETVATWKRIRGGSLPAGVRSVHVVHPGAITGGMGAEIKRSFADAAADVLRWARQDPGWLPADPGCERASGDYVLGSAPIPFADLAFGVPWRLGRKATSSNRRDAGRSIQLFSAGGRYNESAVGYSNAAGTGEGYEDDAGDLPWEPPKARPAELDRGPGSLARLLLGGEPSLGWPDFTALGLPAHPSFGYGPVFRGRADGQVLVLADQDGQDDLFSGRALTGDAGQRLHRFLDLAGAGDDYAVVRPLPVDTQGSSKATVNRALDDPAVAALVSAVVERLTGVRVIVAVGSGARRVAPRVAGPRPIVELASVGESGWKADWRAKVDQVAGHLGGTADAGDPTTRSQIPRSHLPFGTLRWQGTSGDRAVRGSLAGHSHDYYKLVMPAWVDDIAP